MGFWQKDKGESWSFAAGVGPHYADGTQTVAGIYDNDARHGFTTITAANNYFEAFDPPGLLIVRRILFACFANGTFTLEWNSGTVAVPSWTQVVEVEARVNETPYPELNIQIPGVSGFRFSMDNAGDRAAVIWSHEPVKSSNPFPAT